MAEVRYGQLASWDDGNVSGPSDFMSLTEGDNKIRIVTNPFQFIVHWVKDATGQSRKIRCSIKNCPLCRQGIDSQTRWYVGVLDYKSARPKILEIGSQIYKGVLGLKQDDDWNIVIEKSFGPIFGYDLNITRGPKGSQPLYQVKPSPKMKDITDDETTLLEAFFNKVDIAKFTQPSTPEEVAEKMGVSVVSSEKPVKGKESDIKPTVKETEFDFGDEEDK